MSAISEVAKRAGVSVTTVSRVTNRPELVSARTRKRVQQVADELMYLPSYHARAMRGKGSESIGVIIPDFMNLWYSEFISELEIRARSLGLHSVIYSSKDEADKERQYILELIQRQIHGIILCRYAEEKENRKFIEHVSRKVPIVLMDQSRGNLPVSAVFADAYRGFRTLVAYLIGKKLQPVGMIKSYAKYRAAESRYLGYVDELQKHGIDPDPAIIEEADFTAASAYQAAKTLLRRQTPRAIIASSDLMALGVLKCVLEMGLAVPEDVAIAGYDNTVLSTLASPQLTTVAEPIRKMAEKAIELLICRIKNPSLENTDLVLPTRLIIRASTEPMRKDRIRM